MDDIGVGDRVHFTSFEYGYIMSFVGKVETIDRHSMYPYYVRFDNLCGKKVTCCFMETELVQI